MATISQTYTFVAGAIPTAAQWNSNWTTVVNAINGNLDADNVDTSVVATLATANVWTADQTFNDSVKVTLGTGGDADLYYDGTDVILNTAVFGTGDFVVTGGSIELDDSEGVTLGTGKDATIQYNGTNLVINPKAVGSGIVDVDGDVQALTVTADGDTSAGDSATMGYTATEGLILTGQGSTNDVTIKNDADTAVISIPTGTTGVTFAGALTASNGGSLTGTWSDLGTVTTVDINGGTIGGVTFDVASTVGAHLKFNDDTNAAFGTGTDYWYVYDSANTQFELNGTNVDGGGSDGVIFKVDDGTDDVDFTGIITTASGSVIGDVTIATGSITASGGAISFGNENLTTTGTLASGALTVTGAASATTYFDGAGVRSTGASFPASGTGLEAGYFGGAAFIQGFNRTGSSYVPMQVSGSTVALQIAGTTKASVTAAGSVLAGTAAIATTATDGFLYIPSCAGTPTGAPTDHSNMSAIVHDTTNNRIYLYDHVSNAWQYAALT